MINCPLCAGADTKSVFKKGETFFTDGKTSMELEVALCDGCGFVFQASAYTDEYQKKIATVYDNYRMNDNFEFPRRDKKSLESFEFIVSNVKLSKGADILEIGSDRGDFLYMLKEAYADSNIIGIEPGSNHTAQVPTVKGYFDKDSFSSKFDLIVLKHTFEHIVYPKPFLADVMHSLKDGGYIYIEVPSFDVCKKYFLDDFTLEHVSYFSKEVFLRLFDGYEIVAIDNSHFLRVIVKNKKADSKGFEKPDVAEIVEFFATFSKRYNEVRSLLIDHARQGGKLVFYGVGLFFRIFFGGIEKELDSEMCYFVDDGFDGDVEPYFGLRKFNMSELTNNTKIVAVWCTNDYAAQNAMKNRFDKTTTNYNGISLYSTSVTDMQ